MWRRLTSPLARPVAGLADATPALRVLLLGLLLRPAGPWWARGVILVLAAAGLLSQRALRLPLLWIGLTIACGARVAADWPLADNHSYLLTYACLAVAIASLAPAPPLVLSSAARGLLALTFAFAVLWKAWLAPDYLDGRFFTVTLLTDQRFAGAVALIGGLTPEQLAANRVALRPLPAGAELAVPAPFFEPAAFRVLVLAATWGALLLEAALGLGYLLPAPERLRHAGLLLFCAVTYAFAPVAGFGWVLVALGLARTGPDERRWRWAYGGMFLLILAFAEVPWAALLAAGRAP